MLFRSAKLTVNKFPSCFLQFYGSETVPTIIFFHSPPPPANKQPLEAGRALEKEPGGQALAVHHLHTEEEQGRTGPTAKLPIPGPGHSTADTAVLRLRLTWIRVQVLAPKLIDLRLWVSPFPSKTHFLFSEKDRKSTRLNSSH